MNLRLVAVDMFVDDSIMLVTMRVHQAAMALVWRMAVRDPLRNARQVEDAEHDQHQTDGQFHGETDAWRNDHIEKNDGCADTEYGEGVPNAPKDANDSRLPDGALAADNGRNSDDVIGIGGVAHTQNKAEADCCQQIHHAVLSQFHELDRRFNIVRFHHTHESVRWTHTGNADISSQE